MLTYSSIEYRQILTSRKHNVGSVFHTLLQDETKISIDRDSCSTNVCIIDAVFQFNEHT